MKKHYKRRKNKNNTSWIYFLLLIFLVSTIVIFFFYQTGSDFKTITADVSVAGENKSSESIEPESITHKLIQLPAGLERPLCAVRLHSPDHELRIFENYALCYRESYEQAEWSAYFLADFQLEKNAERSNDFRADPEISTGSAQLSDYKKSGFDRGHLTPAADMSFSQKAMSETFYMSNMTPQAPQFNRGIWKDLEAQVRFWVEKYGRAYVVSGPILEKSADQYKSIGENEVAVPDYFYKVVLVPLYGDESDRASSDDTASLMAVGFVIPNQKCEEDFWYYAVSVDEVERLTNLDFYSLLEDDIENTVEADSSFDKLKWQ